jgi:hypothetical protein
VTEEPTVEPDAQRAPAQKDQEDQVLKVLRTFREEPMLWPVAIVVFLVGITFGGMILLYAIRLRALVSGVALLLLLFLTVWGLDADIRERRLRPISRLVLAMWLGSAGGAFVLEWLGAAR